MQYHITAEVIHETTGEVMEVTFTIDDIDLNHDGQPTDEEIAEIVVSNISVVAMKVVAEDEEE